MEIEIKPKQIRKEKKITDDPEYFKNYYKNNIEKFKQRSEQRKEEFITCDICNCDIVKKNKTQHYRTKKHLLKLTDTKN